MYDNNSTDRTAEIAKAAGAVVRREAWQGKGHVVRRMFADVEADVYLLVDGDGTYDAASAPVLLDKLLEDGLDMLNAARADTSTAAYRPGHRFGNRVLSGLVTRLFGQQISDVLSGYRALSRRFVKSFPALSPGFEIETEMTVHALELRMPIAEIKTPYRERPAGSSSKLRTYRDGVRILTTITALVRDERPLRFFGLVGTLLAACSLLLGWPVISSYLANGSRPAAPDGPVGDGPDAARVPEHRERPDPGYRYPRPPGAEAIALPADPAGNQPPPGPAMTVRGARRGGCPLPSRHRLLGGSEAPIVS